jgi:regulatory protein
VRSSSRPDAPGDPAVCRKQAMDLLARREHSRRELERKLAARGYDAAAVAAALDGLETDGLLAAARFAESFIRARAAKGQGPVRIRAELAERGIDPGEFAAFLAAAFDWRALAREVRIKRFGAAQPARYAERARQMRFLQYRGFELDQIDAALDIRDDSD